MALDFDFEGDMSENIKPVIYNIAVTKFATQKVSDTDVREYFRLDRDAWSSLTADEKRWLAVEWASDNEGISFEPDFARKICATIDPE